MQLQRLAQAAVVTGVGDQKVMAAVQVERGEVFPVGIVDAVNAYGGDQSATMTDCVELGPRSAVVEHPQRIGVHM
jgi:hypothetical protein